MFHFFRRKDKAVRYFLGGILLLVCVTMVITLIPGLTGGGTMDETVLAKVGSDKITNIEVGRQLQQMMRNSRLPANMVPLYAPTLLNQMITERVMLNEAQRLGLSVSQEEIAANLRANPALFPNGQFIGYDNYRQIVEQRFNMSVPEFETQYERSLLAEKLRHLITAGVTVSDADVLREFHRRNDKVKIDYVLLKAADLRDKIQITDADVNDYFQKHRTQYEIPERREFRSIYADTVKVRDNVQVTEQDLRDYYNDNRDSFRVEDRAQVAHVLFKTLGKTPAEIQDVRKKADEVLQKLQGGADFAEMAKQYSDDAGSTGKGGDLGWIVRGQTAQEFEKTAFSLDPGKLSGVVQTPIGFEIIKVQGRERAHLQTLEEVRARIEPQVKAIKGQRAVEAETRRIDDAVQKSKGNLQTLAASLGVTVTDTGLLKRGDPVPGAGAAPALDDSLFASALKPTQSTGAIQVPNGVVVAQLVKIEPAHPAELAEVRDQVQNDLRNQKAGEAVNTRMQQLVAAARAQGLAKAAASQGLKVQTSDPVTVDGTIKDVGSASALRQAFQLKAGEVGGPESLADGQVVYQVAAREEAPDTQLAATRDSIRTQLEQMKAMDVFQVFLDSLRTRMEKAGKLQINEAGLQRLAQSYQ